MRPGEEFGAAEGRPTVPDAPSSEPLWGDCEPDTEARFEQVPVLVELALVRLIALTELVADGGACGDAVIVAGGADAVAVVDTAGAAAVGNADAVRAPAANAARTAGHSDSPNRALSSAVPLGTLTTAQYPEHRST